jgi:hypothetical protein
MNSSNQSVTPNTHKRWRLLLHPRELQEYQGQLSFERPTLAQPFKVAVSETLAGDQKTGNLRR